MEIKNQQTIGQIIDAWISQKKIKSSIDVVKIEQLWPNLMGKMIANHTKEIQLRGDKLYFTIDNQTLKNELFYSKDKIREILNNELKEVVIKEVFIY